MWYYDLDYMMLPLLTLGTLEISIFSTLANSEDPDEMPHNVAFHLGLHDLLRYKQSDM